MCDDGTAVPGGEPVEEYLDKLLLTLSGSPRQIRQTLAEIEAHLQDAVADELAAGKTQAQAEAAAVARIGAVRDVTGRPVAFARPGLAMLRRTILAGALIGGVGLVAVGLSGAVSWLLAVARGGAFVTAPFPPGSYTPADCANWLSGDPGANTCATAMIADHVGDIVLQSLAGGIVGIALLAAFWWLRRRWQDRGTLTALPVGSAEAAGGILALLTAIGMLGIGVDVELVQRGQGAGQPFSLAIAALAAAVFFAIRLYRARTGVARAA